MSEIILLGAGASAEANVPTAYKMTEDIVEKFQNIPKYNEVMNFVVGGLLFQEGVKGRNPLSPKINVEDLFNAVRLLAERNTLEAAPFVGSWHWKVEEFDRIDPHLNLNELIEGIYESIRDEIIDALTSHPSSYELDSVDRSIQSAGKKILNACQNKQSLSLGSSESIGRHIEKYLSEVAKKWTSELKRGHPRSNFKAERGFKDAVSDSQTHPGEGQIFEAIAILMVRILKDIVWIENNNCVKYLFPLINLAKDRRLVISTLNYDNSIELAAASNDIHCNTCIEDWSNKGVFDISENGLHLLKLHGSIDWIWEQDLRIEERTLPHSKIHKENPKKLKNKYFRPAIVFGQRNKLTTEGPFLDFLRAFQQELMSSETLTVIGYSFGDDHINTYISQWLNLAPEKHIRIIDPQFEISNTNFISDLKLLRVKKPEQVLVLAKNASEGIIDLYG